MTYKHYLKSIHESYYEVQLNEGLMDKLKGLASRLGPKEKEIANQFHDILQRFIIGQASEEEVKDFIKTHAGSDEVNDMKDKILDVLDLLKNKNENVSGVLAGGGAVVTTIGALFAMIGSPGSAALVVGLIMLVAGGIGTAIGGKDITKNLP